MVIISLLNLLSVVETRYTTTMVYVANYSLFGLWTMLLYRYFSIDKTTAARQSTDDFNEPSTTNSNTEGYIFGTTELSPPEPTTRKFSLEMERRAKYNFNIFDGTNAGGAYADFIFDGDEEDEMTDQQETQKWATVQQHL